MGTMPDAPFLKRVYIAPERVAPEGDRRLLRNEVAKYGGELGSMLKRVADLRSDVSQFTFMRCDARTRVARLLYRRESVGPRGSMLEFRGARA